ncbi:MAG: hypothetical protein U0003_04545 [Vampirovibrionales bacterium]
MTMNPLAQPAAWLSIFIMSLLGLMGVAPKGFAATPIEPVAVTLAPRQSIVGKRGAIGLVATFQARQPVTLCLLANPLSQFNLTVTRIGQGPRPLPPSLVALPDPSRYSPFRKEGLYARLVPLKTGQMFSLPLQVPRLPFADGSVWESAEYKIGGTFALCDQSPFQGAVVAATGPAPTEAYAEAVPMTGSRAALWEYPGNVRPIAIRGSARFYLSLER